MGYRPNEIPWIYRLLDLAAAGGPERGPLHLLLESVGEIGFAWDSSEEGWLRPGLPLLKNACWQETGSSGGPMLDIAGSLQLLRTSHARRTYACARETWYPVVRDLHRFFIAMSRAIVNDDGKVCVCVGGGGGSDTCVPDVSVDMNAQCT